MISIDYHRNIMSEEGSHPYVQRALEFLTEFETAVNQVYETGDWVTYCQNVNEYDKYLWEVYHNEKQATNPINTIQTKKYSSYRETLLFPLWKRIGERLNFQTEVVQNKSVAQVIFDDGTCQYKDLDGGLYINQTHLGNLIPTPVLVHEDKGGHFCATQGSNVNAIFRKFKDLNRNIITITTTDNKVTIGKDKDYGFMSSTNYIFSLRGKNVVEYIKHSSLVGDRFAFIEESIIDKLNSIGENPFLIQNLNVKTKHVKTIRESIDKKGVMVNF